MNYWSLGNNGSWYCRGWFEPRVHGTIVSSINRVHVCGALVPSFLDMNVVSNHACHPTSRTPITLIETAICCLPHVIFHKQVPRLHSYLYCHVSLGGWTLEETLQWILWGPSLPTQNLFARKWKSFKCVWLERRNCTSTHPFGCFGSFVSWPHQIFVFEDYDHVNRK